MKKAYSYALVVLIMTVLFGCKKDKGESKPGLTGTWELAEYSTSWIPNIIYSPGNGNTLQFNDAKYAFMVNGQVKEEGTYATMEDNTVEENVCLTELKDKYTMRVDLDNGTTTRKVFFYIADDKLYMISGCYAVDGGVKQVYRRISTDISNGGNW